ncbi:hypothetical protein [Sessilibacter sp. MAH4]
MNAFFAFILFSIICVGSLLVVSWANHIETRNRLIRQRIHILKKQYEEIQQLIITVDQTVEPRVIVKLLNEESLSILASARELDSDDSFIIAATKNAESLNKELSEDKEPDKRIYRIRESDAQIALAQYHLEKAANVLIHKQSRGEISYEELTDFKLALLWAKLMLTVYSLIAQGHQAVSRGELLPARAYYQKARGGLTQSSHPDKRRKLLIKELKEIIDGKKQSISEDLMPENDYNPDRKIKEDNLLGEDFDEENNLENAKKGAAAG